MPTKRKNGKYVKCWWCGEFPHQGCNHTYTHTNIHNDPPVKNFCSKECLNRWTFQDDNRIIEGFSNLNERLYINTIYKFD